MKEIGKLIELFKDYVENYGNDTKDPTIDYAVIYDGQGFYVGARFYSDEKVLSKKFGFIKWLVENDKIDTQNLITYMNGTSLTYSKVPSTDCVGMDKIWNKFYTEVLLMLLSISDTPIEDLISYLK